MRTGRVLREGRGGKRRPSLYTLGKATTVTSQRPHGRKAVPRGPRGMRSGTGTVNGEESGPLNRARVSGSSRATVCSGPKGVGTRRACLTLEESFDRRRRGPHGLGARGPRDLRLVSAPAPAPAPPPLA